MKQYVGLTTKTLRERINHHRSTIIRKMKRYISSHFSLLDQNINDLTVQIIGSTHPNSLAQTEQFWINTLKTTQPLGLICIDQAWVKYMTNVSNYNYKYLEKVQLQIRIQILNFYFKYNYKYMHATQLSS